MITLPDSLRPQEGQTNGGGPKPPDEPLLLMAAAEMGQEGAFDRQPRSDAEGAIERAAKRHGMDPAVLKGIAGIESGMNPGSNRYRSTQYKGLFQIGREEWAQYGRGGDIFDADQNADAAARMLKDHGAWFKDRYGRSPEAGELYMMHQQGRGFYSQGTMTNIGGNPYPGMRGPQTPASFEAGWTARLSREIARYGGSGAVAANPEQSREGSKFGFDLRQATPDLDFLAKGIPLPKVDASNLGPPSQNIVRQSSHSVRGIFSQFLAERGLLKPDALGDNELSKALGGEDLLRELDKVMLRIHGRRRAKTIADEESIGKSDREPLFKGEQR